MLEDQARSDRDCSRNLHTLCKQKLLDQTADNGAVSGIDQTLDESHELILSRLYVPQVRKLPPRRTTVPVCGHVVGYPRIMGRQWIWVGGPLVVVIIVIAAIRQPLALLVVPVIALGVCFFRYAALRVVVFIIGALLVFQTSEGISAPKVAYLGLVALAVGLALIRMPRILRTTWGQEMRPALIGAGLLAAWVALVTLPYSVVVEGVSPSAWARDAITYFLISGGVVIAIEAAESTTLRQARALALGTGVVVAVGFAARWVSLRGFGESETNQSLLASFVGVAFPLGLAFALALVGSRVRPAYALLGVFFLLALLVTGTRSAAVFAVVFLGLIGLRNKARVGVVRVASALGAAALAVIVLLPVAGAAFSSEQFISQRFEAGVRALTGGVTQDRSGAIRARAYDFAAEIWRDHVLMGQGLGRVFPDPSAAGFTTSFSLDTPLSYPAKFGLLGTILLIASVALIARALLRPGQAGYSIESTAFRGALVVVLALLPFGAPTEDKGFALSLALAVLCVTVAKKFRLESVDSRATDQEILAAARV